MTDATPTTTLPALALQSIAIQAFRCLRNTGPLPFQVGRILLAGENGGGKSSCLDAIEFLLSGLAIVADDQTKDSDTEEIVVEGVFVPYDDSTSIHTLVVRAGQTFGSPRVMEVKDWVHPSFGSRPDQMTVPELKAAFEVASIDIPKGAVKTQLVALGEAWIAKQPKDDLISTWRPIAATDRARLPRVTRFSSTDSGGPLSVVQGLITREAKRLIAEPAFSDELAQIGAELDRAIQPSLNLICRTIEQHCSDLEGVNIGAAFDFSRVTPMATATVSVRQMQLSVASLGQGKLRRIAIAVHEATACIMANDDASSTEILLYNEPDTHLDVSGQRQLFSILERQSNLAHVQVAVATHSPHLIDLVSLPALLHFTLTEASETTVTTVAGTSYVEDPAFYGAVYTSLGLSNSVVLDGWQFLLVEVDTEQAAIPVLFQAHTGRSLASCGVHLVNTKGTRAMRQFSKMLRYEWGRDVVLLADTDLRSEHEKWIGEVGLQAHSSAFFVGEQEFEDAFSDDVWSQALKEHFPCKDPSKCWSIADIAAIRAQGGKFSKHLHAVVGQRWQQGAVGKPDIGHALASSCSPDEIPATLIACFDHIAKPEAVLTVPASA